VREYQRNTVTVILSLVAVSAAAQAPIVYPAKGQSAEQQQKDSGECATWAKQTTGIDPVVLAAIPAAAPAQPQETGPQGQRVKGAVRGAAAGAIVGEVVDNDAGGGAAAGAAVGVVAGGSRARRDRRNQQEEATQQQEQAAAQKQQQLATYQRANAACLEGRGYVLK